MHTLREHSGPIVAAGLMVLEAIIILLLSPNGCSRSLKMQPAQGEIVEPEIETKEVSIGGPQRVSNYVDPDRSVRVEFEVFAVVHLESATEFENLLKVREKTMVELVREVVASARIDEIHDARLPRIKKELIQGVQEIIGRDKQYLENIVIPTFRPHFI